MKSVDYISKKKTMKFFHKISKIFIRTLRQRLKIFYIESLKEFLNKFLRNLKTKISEKISGPIPREIFEGIFERTTGAISDGIKKKS